MMLVFEKEVLKALYAHGPRWKDQTAKKIFFILIWHVSENYKALILDMADFNGYVGRQIHGFEGVQWWHLRKQY